MGYIEVAKRSYRHRVVRSGLRAPVALFLYVIDFSGMG